MHNLKTCVRGILAAILLVPLFLPACKSATGPNAQHAPVKCCNCPGDGRGLTGGGFCREAMLWPEEWSDAERRAAAKSLRNARIGGVSIFAKDAMCWQFQIPDSLLTKILAAKEAQAKREGFSFRLDAPSAEFQQKWFGDLAMGAYKSKEGIDEPCRLAWWSANERKADFFRSWGSDSTAPAWHWDFAMKVCPIEDGMRWVFVRYWNE